MEGMGHGVWCVCVVCRYSRVLLDRIDSIPCGATETPRKRTQQMSHVYGYALGRCVRTRGVHSTRLDSTRPVWCDAQYPRKWLTR